MLQPSAPSRSDVRWALSLQAWSWLCAVHALAAEKPRSGPLPPCPDGRCGEPAERDRRMSLTPAGSHEGAGAGVGGPTPSRKKRSVSTDLRSRWPLARNRAIACVHVCESSRTCKRGAIVWCSCQARMRSIQVQQRLLGRWPQVALCIRRKAFITSTRYHNPFGRIPHRH